MPEVPEVASRAREINQALRGKTIQFLEVVQPKCLNLPVADFCAALTGATIQGATHHGKWIFIDTDRGYLLLNLGMGGEILLRSRESLPAKYRLLIDFTDGATLAINFWWFGYAHFVASGALAAHEMTARLGPNVLDLTAEEFRALMRRQKGRLKAVLLDQSRLAGIGNAYIHDILFFARLHPLRLVTSLTDEDLVRLYQGIRDGLLPSLEKNGAFYELDLFGNKGGFMEQDIVIGYREGQPCPRCATPIEKIKTGSTSSFICPSCQNLV